MKTLLYKLLWCINSSSTVIFDQWLLVHAGYNYPILLTAWHFVFATAVTQILARTTSILDSRHYIRFNEDSYTQTLLPVGLAFGGSLVCLNIAYTCLSLSYIQMFKAGAPVAMLITSWLFRVARPSAFSLITILVIGSGILIASGGEGSLSGIGVCLLLGVQVFEALGNVLTQVMLAGEEVQMNPLVLLYYCAPVCACVLALFGVVLEGGSFAWSEVERVGYPMLIFNAVVAFSPHLSSLLLGGKSSGLAVPLTDIFNNILPIAFAVVVWHEQISLIEGLGYIIVLFGLVCYSLGYEGLELRWNSSMSKTLQLQRISRMPRKDVLYLVVTFLSLFFVACDLSSGLGAHLSGHTQTNSQRELSSVPLTGERLHPLYPPMATCGGDKFTPSRQQWAAAAGKYVELMEDKFTIVIQTFKRPAIFNATLTTLLSERIPSLHEIAVVWNEVDGKPPADMVSKHGVSVRYTLAERDSLNSKLLPDPKFKTQAILLQDDDVHYHLSDLEFVFQSWRQFGKHRLVGGLPRCAEPRDGRLKYTFCTEKSDTYDMVLSNLAFSHISFLDFYHSDNYYATVMREHVDKVFNCEDIALNYITSMLTCTGPLQVVGRERYSRAHPKKGISSGKDHLKLRDNCLNEFTALFGYPVLVGQTGRIVRGVHRLQG